MFINKTRIYSIGDYTFHNFVFLNNKEIDDVWKWRNDDAIRKLMYNKEIFSIESHIQFVKALSEREDVAYWIVKKENDPIGVTYLVDIKANESSAELGYYMVPQRMKSGLGLEFVYHVFSFHFDTIGMTNLYSAIDNHNKNAIAVGTFMGCVFGEELSIGSDANAKYVSWTIDKEDFEKDREKKSDIRSFVSFIRQL